MTNIDTLVADWSHDTDKVREYNTPEERCDYLSSIDNLSYLKEWLELILSGNYEGEVQKIADKLYINSAGFYRLNIADTSDSSIKLHLFDDTNEPMKTNIHLHGFSAISYVLDGNISNTSFVLSQLSEEEEYQFQPLFTEFKKGLFSGSWVDVFEVCKNNGISNLQMADRFNHLYISDPQIIERITDNMYNILLGSEEKPTEETIVLMMLLGIGDVSYLASIFIHFQMFENERIIDIGQKKLAYESSEELSSGEQYSMPGNMAHQVHAVKAKSLFITDKIPYHNGITYEGGHLKGLGISKDPYELRSPKYYINDKLRILTTNARVILDKIK